MSPQRVAIVGSRNYPYLHRVIAYVQDLPAGTTVVSGGAIGVDIAAETAAYKRGLGVVLYPADWVGLGRGAGFARNRKIVADSDRVVAFWNGVSLGTAHTIKLAREVGKPVLVFGLDDEVTPQSLPSTTKGVTK
jgi:predicted Rossmann fold nucleotide-binding protein DprA/Smf involved in DNA uptake